MKLIIHLFPFISLNNNNILYLLSEMLRKTLTEKPDINSSISNQIILPFTIGESTNIQPLKQVTPKTEPNCNSRL